MRLSDILLLSFVMPVASRKSSIESSICFSLFVVSENIKQERLLLKVFFCKKITFQDMSSLVEFAFPVWSDMVWPLLALIACLYILLLAMAVSRHVCCIVC